MKFILMVLLVTMPLFNSVNNDAQKLSQKELQTLVEKARKKFEVPAISVITFNNERILLQETQGMRVVNTDSPVTPDHYFHIGSCSKSILAVIAAKMIEDGLISWETRFFEVFPELKKESKIDYLSITLKDLFLCKAGIKAFTSSDEKYPFLNHGTDKRLEFTKWLLKQPPVSIRTAEGNFQHLYSNAGYTIITEMLERVSAKSWEELIKQTLVSDLKLEVLFGWPNQQDPMQPWGHGKFDFDPLSNVEKKLDELKEFSPDDIYKLNDLIAPAGDLSMKPMDFARYIQLHLQGLTGTDNYLSSQMFQFINFGNDGFSIGVGNSRFAGKRIAGSDGSAGTFYCRSIIVPEDNFGFTVNINAGSVKAVDWITLKIAKKHYHWWWKFWI